jgi:hypothetical protein
MFRLLVISMTGLACVAAGATAGLLAFASELGWPLSAANFGYSARLGAYCGIASAVTAALCLATIDRKHLWLGGAVALVVTWLLSCAGVWWHVVTGLGGAARLSQHRARPAMPTAGRPGASVPARSPQPQTGGRRVSACPAAAGG